MTRLILDVLMSSNYEFSKDGARAIRRSTVVVSSRLQRCPTDSPWQVYSYGHIAHLLGFPRRARQVGICLKHLPTFDPTEPENHFFHDQNVPWQRVLNSKGGISPRG